MERHPIEADMLLRLKQYGRLLDSALRLAELEEGLNGAGTDPDYTTIKVIGAYAHAKQALYRAFPELNDVP